MPGKRPGPGYCRSLLFLLTSHDGHISLHDSVQHAVDLAADGIHWLGAPVPSRLLSDAIVDQEQLLELSRQHGCA